MSIATSVICFGPGFVVEGMSPRCCHCNPALVEELWIGMGHFTLRGAVDNKTLDQEAFDKATEKFTSLKKIVMYNSSPAHCEPITVPAGVEKVILHNNEYKRPDELLEVAGQIMLSKKSSDDKFGKRTGHIAAEAFNGFLDSVHDDIVFNDMTVTSGMINNLNTNTQGAMFKGHKMVFNNCRIEAGFNFPGNNASFYFNNCTFEPTTAVSIRSNGSCFFTNMPVEEIGIAVNAHFTKTKLIKMVGVNSIPEINFVRSPTDPKKEVVIESESETFDATAVCINGFSHLRITVPMFEGCRLFAFEFHNYAQVYLTETRSPHNPRILQTLSNVEKYQIYTGEIPMPQHVFVNVIRGETTFGGTQSVHARGFESSCFREYEKLYDTVNDAFKAITFLRSKGVEHEILVILGRYSVARELQAVVFRASQFNKDEFDTWVQRLKEEVGDGEGLCLLGMKNRLINSLLGLADEIELVITMSEDLQNQCSVGRSQGWSKETLIKNLLARGHTDESMKAFVDAY